MSSIRPALRLSCLKELIDKRLTGPQFLLSHWDGTTYSPALCTEANHSTTLKSVRFHHTAAALIAFATHIIRKHGETLELLEIEVVSLLDR